MDAKDLEFTLAHIGINQENADEAKKTVEILSTLFGFPARETEGSFFVNEQFEVMKMPFLGRLGHIGVYTNNAEEARKYLESKGIVFNEETAIYGSDKKLRVIYFKEDIAGFAFHISQKG